MGRRPVGVPMYGLNTRHGCLAAVKLATASAARVSYAVASNGIQPTPDTQYRCGSHNSQFSSIARWGPAINGLQMHCVSSTVKAIQEAPQQREDTRQVRLLPCQMGPEPKALRPQ